LFDPSSRYFTLKDLHYAPKKKSIGEKSHKVITIPYKERRFLPAFDQIEIIQDVTVGAGERLDNISAHTIGDPEQFWHICDANDFMHPLDLTSEQGQRIHIGMQR
jgi:hypothetical protein